MEYRVVETFYSFQGEGLSIGTPCFFIRLSGCNLKCPWCDTKYAWSGGSIMTERDLAMLVPHGVPVTITGGEPLLHDLLPLVNELATEPIIVETNGTIRPQKKLLDRVVWNVSPKPTLPNYEMMFPEEYANCFKFVISSLDDIDIVKSFVERYEIPWSKVVLQPDNSRGPEWARRLWLWLSERLYLFPSYEWKYIPQTHVLLFGRCKGV